MVLEGFGHHWYWEDSGLFSWYSAVDFGCDRHFLEGNCQEGWDPDGRVSGLACNPQSPWPSKTLRFWSFFARNSWLNPPLLGNDEKTRENQHESGCHTFGTKGFWPPAFLNTPFPTPYLSNFQDGALCAFCHRCVDLNCVTLPLAAQAGNLLCPSYILRLWSLFVCPFQYIYSLYSWFLVLRSWSPLFVAISQAKKSRESGSWSHILPTLYTASTSIYHLMSPMSETLENMRTISVDFVAM